MMTASWCRIPACLLSHISVFFLRSLNGTYVNNIPICSGQETQLHKGDLIGIRADEKTNSDCYVFWLRQKVFKVMQLQFSCLYIFFWAKFRAFGVFVYTLNFHSSCYL